MCAGEIIAYLYGVYLILLAFDHYKDFTAVEALVAERDMSRKLNQWMVCAFRRRSTQTQSTFSSQSDCQPYDEEEAEIKRMDGINMNVNLTTTIRRSSSLRNY